MKVSKYFGIIAVVTLMVSCNNSIPTTKTLNTEVDSVSYAIGLDMASKLKANYKELNSDVLIQGYKAGVDSTKTLINPLEISKILNTYFGKRQKEQAEKSKAAAMKAAEEKYADVKKEGEDFLAENKTKKGVITTASGLQYKVLKEGKGAIPKLTDRVKIHYHGTLIDGTVFDSSVNKKTPITHNVNGFVKGFTEALQLMKVGSKHKIFLPQNLAYGINPGAGKIRPFDTIIFELELLEIKK